MVLSMFVTIMGKRSAIKPLSSIRSGYNNGVMASELWISDKSRPKEDAIEPNVPPVAEDSISGAIFVSVESVLGVQIINKADRANTVGRIM